VPREEQIVERANSTCISCLKVSDPPCSISRRSRDAKAGHSIGYIYLMLFVATISVALQRGKRMVYAQSNVGKIVNVFRL
jgi:cbb3-type cytochrome oxidase subunit 3